MPRLFSRLCLTAAISIGVAFSANGDLTTQGPCSPILSHVQTGGGDVNLTTACEVVNNIYNINISPEQILVLSKEALEELQKKNGGQLATEELDAIRRDSKRLSAQGANDTARITIITLADIAAVPEKFRMKVDDDLKAAARAAALGRFDEAKKLYGSIREPAFKDPALRGRAAADACFGLAVLAEQRLDYPSAEAYLREAMAWQEQEPKYRAYLSQLLAFVGRAKEAVPLAEQAEELVDGDASGNRARMYRWIGDAFHDSLVFTKALDAYDKAQNEWKIRQGLKADYAEILLSAAGLNARLRKFQPAADLYSKALQSGAIAQLTKIEKLAFWNNLGVFYLNAGCSDVAKQYAEFVLKHEGDGIQSDDPLLAFSRGVRGRALYIDSDLPAAVEALQEAVDAIGRAFDSRHWRAAQFRTYKAEVLLAMNDYGGARKILVEALDVLNSKPDEGHLQFAITLAILSRVELVEGDPDAPKTLDSAERYLASLTQIAQAEPLWRIKLARAEQAALNGDVPTSKAQLLEALDADQSYGVRLILKKAYHAGKLAAVLSEIGHDLELRTKLSLSLPVKCSSAPMPSLL